MWAASQYYIRRCGLLLQTGVVCLSINLPVGQTAEPIDMSFGLRTLVDPRNRVLDGVEIPVRGAVLRGGSGGPL